MVIHGTTDVYGDIYIWLPRNHEFELFSNFRRILFTNKICQRHLLQAFLALVGSFMLSSLWLPQYGLDMVAKIYLWWPTRIKKTRLQYSASSHKTKNHRCSPSSVKYCAPMKNCKKGALKQSKLFWIAKKVAPK